MAATDHFIKIGIQYSQIEEFLQDKLSHAGFGGIQIHKTPMGHRIEIQAERLGMVIGRRGKHIHELTEELKDRFGLDNPELDVKNLPNSSLKASVMAARLVSQIERGFHFRRAAYSLIRRIMSAGARGVEIIVSGKLTSQRARTESFREGFVAKCGQPADVFVDKHTTYVVLKQGLVGIKVKIMRPDAVLPDEATFLESPFIVEEESEVEAEAPEPEVEAEAPEPEVEAEAPEPEVEAEENNVTETETPERKAVIDDLEDEDEDEDS
ncbi:MAG: 30S ribosomal protein S3 [Promethearchaeota archaeon]